MPMVFVDGLAEAARRRLAVRGGGGVKAAPPFIPAEPKAGSRWREGIVGLHGRPSVSRPTISLTSAYFRCTSSKPSSPGGRSVVEGRGPPARRFHRRAGPAGRRQPRLMTGPHRRSAQGAGRPRAAGRMVSFWSKSTVRGAIRPNEIWRWPRATRGKPIAGFSFVVGDDRIFRRDRREGQQDLGAPVGHLVDGDGGQHRRGRRRARLGGHRLAGGDEGQAASARTSQPGAAPALWPCLRELTGQIGAHSRTENAQAQRSRPGRQCVGAPARAQRYALRPGRCYQSVAAQKAVEPLAVP